MNTRFLTSLAAGAIFGLGLAISGMINPAKILNFLDIAGAWDPTLALVMGGALAVTIPAFRWVLKRSTPVLDGRFHVPSRKDIDLRLVSGAALFGIGWGLAGDCPGPAITALVTGLLPVLGFFAALVAGNWLASRL